MEIGPKKKLPILDLAANGRGLMSVDTNESNDITSSANSYTYQVNHVCMASS